MERASGWSGCEGRGRARHAAATAPGRLANRSCQQTPSRPPHLLRGRVLGDAPARRQRRAQAEEGTQGQHLRHSGGVRGGDAAAQGSTEQAQRAQQAQQARQQQAHPPTHCTGPKISSRAMAMLSATSANTVGSTCAGEEEEGRKKGRWSEERGRGRSTGWRRSTGQRDSRHSAAAGTARQQAQQAQHTAASSAPLSPSSHIVSLGALLLAAAQQARALLLAAVAVGQNLLQLVRVHLQRWVKRHGTAVVWHTQSSMQEPRHPAAAGGAAPAPTASPPAGPAPCPPQTGRPARASARAPRSCCSHWMGREAEGEEVG